MLRCALAGLILLASGCRPDSQTPPPPPIKAAGVAPGDPILNQVRAYLAANLDDPDYRELRWWPPRMKEGGTWPMCRMKYRAKNKFGAWEMFDQIYTLEGGRIEDVYSPGANQLFRDRAGYRLIAVDEAGWYFPDDEKTPPAAPIGPMPRGPSALETLFGELKKPRPESPPEFTPRER